MNKSRYFLISYTAVLKDGTIKLCQITFDNNENKFLNLKDFEIVVKKKFDTELVIINNIFEFQSKEDFDEFVR